jgi:hypothetical protein
MNCNIISLLKQTALLLLLFATPFVSCSNDDVVDVPYTPQTEIGQRLLANSSTVARVYTDTSFVVALGVTETDIHFQKSNGRSTHVFIIDVDLNQPGVTVKVGMPYDTDVRKNFQRQTLTEIAEYSDRAWSRVVAMVNADFWDVSNMDIRGPIHRNGVILKNSFIYKASLPQQALSFIAMTKDNRMVIADSADYRGMMYNLKEVTGSGVIVLRNGELSGQSYAGLDPRTCIGYSDDGHVYFLVVDGRVEFYSYGFTYAEMGSVMQGLGCSWAANLDGGGSSQMLIRHPIADVFQIRNRPSDGQERAVVNTWMVTVAEP